jgi:hypothetical protein
MALVLTVGTNTYVSVVDADEFIRTYYLPTEDLFVWWNGIDAVNQALYLYRSCKMIEKLPFTGSRYLVEQTLQFPRNDELVVPDNLIEAQILNAYYLSQPLQDIPSNRNVKKYTIDDLTEEFWSNTSSQSTSVSKEALELLKEWLSGGYAIR